MHNIYKAVKQMIALSTQKAKYFGTDKLTRDINFEDLSVNDFNVTLPGRHHIQDVTDRHGMAIVYCLSSNFEVRVASEIRILYFIFFNFLIPIHSVQMKVVVLIHYNVTKPGNNQQTNEPAGIKAIRLF